ADCTINITWPGITVEATTPGNGTWHTDNVTISGTAAANVTRTIISEDFEGVWGADWYIDDINPTGGVDTWGETTRRVHSGERSLWCAGSDGGAALFDDFDNSAGFVSSWYRSSEGPDISLWTKVTSGYRGAAQGDRLAVVTSEGLDVTEWLGARVVDCSNFGNLSLSFYLDYQAGSGDGWGRVMWSNWSTFPSFTLLDQFTTDTLGWQTYDLSVLDGEHNGYLAFVYHGTDDLYMAVDDVTLAGDKMAYDAWMHSDAIRYFRAPDDYDKAQLEFQYWLESEQGQDSLGVTYYSQTTQQGGTLWAISGGAGQWRTGRVDVPIDATSIGFVFMSAGGVSSEGAYVDDV
ncbi:MAG: hypothetical protein KAQ96_09415, partial [Thermoplasmata archaeon]|nr:hypothetical protein [Thermoplasmata archaeon]